MVESVSNTPNQNKGVESVEVLRPRCLLIDDYDGGVKMFNEYFHSFDNFKAVVCNTVEEAMAAIASYQPKLIFLDHYLTNPVYFNRHEGLEIADQVRVLYPDIEIYSMVDDAKMVDEYIERGIKRINKNDIIKIQSIISGKKK